MGTRESRKRILLEEPIFSLKFLGELAKFTDIGRSVILLTGLLGYADPVEAESKLGLIREELLRVPKGGNQISDSTAKHIEGIIEYLRNAIRSVESQ